MKVSVVILNWNTAGYLERWLPVLLDSCGPDTGVVVADNASTDGSLELLRRRFPEVGTIKFSRNFGFTGGYDRALEKLLDPSKNPDVPEYVVLLNSDVEVSRGWLEPLVRYMDTHPDCGVCGPKLHKLRDGEPEFEYAGAAGGLLDRFGYPFCRGRVLSRTESDRGQYDKPEDVLWVSGACLMTRSSLWKTLGGLDDRFFAHMEEIDYCWRAQLLGWRVTVVPESSVRHLGGGTLPGTSPFKLRLNYRNNLLLLRNNLAPTYAASGMSLCRADRKALRLIRFRMMLDRLSAAVYLLTGRTSYYRAVVAAHREYRRSAVKASPFREGAQVKGLRDVCIIPLSFFKGKRVFNAI